MSSIRFRLSRMVLLATGFCSAMAHAAAPPAISDSDIVVTGGAYPDRDRIVSLSHAVTAKADYRDPLARFADPVCFLSAGLPQDMLVTIANRMVDDAGDAGIALAGKDCQPNVAVLFVDHGAIDLQGLRLHDNRLFGNLKPEDIRAIIREPGPVHTWWITQVRSSDGKPLQPGSATGPAMLSIQTNSRLRAETKREVQYAVILIDREALVGLGTDQIADYAAMRVLGGARPPISAQDGTILTLFQPGATPPGAMTAFDRSYLKAFYSGAADLKAASKTNQIATSIERDARKSDRAKTD
ncbi:hypothetical protein [Novosphingobium sp. 9]|uniref:hypothetical protein n=1 Tax=Novosphingobium sp. 9 TaxID=2025349 RepID=UPI0021B4E980|nr:hypothetical protein [Novosphingobium sp. 9]